MKREKYEGKKIFTYQIYVVASMQSIITQTLGLKNKIYLFSVLPGENVKIRFNTSSSVTGMMLGILFYPSYTHRFGLVSTNER